jgi:hypothetical protein
VVFVFGAQLLGVDSERDAGGLAGRGARALVAAGGGGGVRGAGLLGTPQIVLIAAAVVAFGR